MTLKWQTKSRLQRWSIGGFALLAVILISLAVDTRLASAHAFLLRTDPADGLVLSSAPKQMRFWFSEALEIDLTTITLQDGNDKTWQLKPHADADDPSIVIVALPELSPSAYRVAWRTVSDEDLHVISGFVVFGIQQPVNREGSGQTQTAASLAETIFHWINLLTVASTVGALILILFLFPSIRRGINEGQVAALDSLQRKTILAALRFCIIAFLAGLLMIWDKFSGVGAKTIQDFMNIDYVRREVASEACLIVIAFAILFSFRTNAVIVRNVLLFFCAPLWIVLQALNSHASAFNDFSFSRVLAYAFHFLGASLWMGAQVVLILLVAPHLRRARIEQVALAREVYIRFGVIAALGVMVLIVSGLYSAGQQIASLDALLLSSYGRTLIMKTTIFLLAGLIGLSHASHFHPKVAAIIHKLIPRWMPFPFFGRANPTATLRFEVLGGAAIFLLAAYLGSTEPARGPKYEAPIQEVSVVSAQSSSHMANDLLVNFSIKPNQPGQNFITVGVFNTRRPAPAQIEQVVVKLVSPDQQEEIRLTAVLSGKDGVYQISTGAIDLSGDWKISVIVQRAGLSDTILDMPWAVAPAATFPLRPTLISAQPLAPVLTAASLLLFMLFAGAWLTLVLKPDLFSRKNDTASSSNELYQ